MYNRLSGHKRLYRLPTQGLVRKVRSFGGSNMKDCKVDISLNYVRSCALKYPEMLNECTDIKCMDCIIYPFITTECGICPHRDLLVSGV